LYSTNEKHSTKQKHKKANPNANRLALVKKNMQNTEKLNLNQQSSA